MTIHWCGTGLSAIPGLRRLLEAGEDVCVWNRTVEKARETVGDLTDNIKAFTLDDLTEALRANDIVVSMLPGDLHVPLATICIEKGAHFVSSSYISPEMAALDAVAQERGVCLVNEVGLDPGIDHLMAHHLVADYRASDAYDPTNTISFLSYCGGVPKHTNAFRYKFSWSPLGVLKALRSPSRSIRNFSTLDVARPWDAIQSYSAPLAAPETFEVYPNRDSLPFIEDYQFEPEWRLKNFVRGTLRLNGWSEAWAPVFAEIETLSGEDGDKRLKEMSDEFWDQHAYEDGEPDRVVLCVSLSAERDGTPVYDKTYALDAWGDERGSAMARLVSVTVSLAVQSVKNREIHPGVTAAPRDPKLVEGWLHEVESQAQYLAIKSAV
ncbi:MULTISPECIES: saccharopine dehydrogenase family protein [Halocynthiibacter]|uniref:Saccharopine dehydrogenase NADP-binding domain-containing protein n=1 Tax=Halocynthiibacter halioticoli TaxID=2986804 RepID=A0AAE3LTT8_9RHOB|nr:MULTISPECIES: saccharopine dehydrogenase family protein [Halocynthiibacter]MCV6825746.1 saccharopine dehydrogenase NADP-binding domain-containing protein [Halocynthiibacter halioticoli]MCW4058747.1 saccharopine dehydrogenase NADP-binding domain-containing protein [Halocynthiibacter sp. SDUM655004]